MLAHLVPTLPAPGQSLTRALTESGTLEEVGTHRKSLPRRQEEANRGGGGGGGGGGVYSAEGASRPVLAALNS